MPDRISSVDPVCPECKSHNVKSKGEQWQCADCRKRFNKEKRHRLPNHIGPPCPDCNSKKVASKGKDWLCRDCGRWFSKNYRTIEKIENFEAYMPTLEVRIS